MTVDGAGASSSTVTPADATAVADRFQVDRTTGEPPAASLRRTLAVAGPARRRLALATTLGAGASGAAIGLVATSAWLISTTSLRPEESVIALAIVGVQFFALARGLLRYEERIVGHDAAFRVLSSLRSQLYGRLEQLAPSGLPAFRRGDLLARLVHDVESLQDVVVRVVPPFAITAAVGAGTVAAMWWLLPADGLVLLVTLVTAATLVPWLTGRLARRAESRQAGARARLTASVVELLEGAPELVACGALGERLEETRTAGTQLRQIASVSASSTGIGLGLTTALTGLATWGALAVGVPAVVEGRLPGVDLAVIALVPLATFELVANLPQAVQATTRVRRAAGRVYNVVESAPPVLDPRRPAEITSAPHRVEASGVRVRYRAQQRCAIDGVGLDLSPGRRVAVVGPSGAGKSTLAATLLRFLPYEDGSITLDGRQLASLRGDDVRLAIGLAAQDAHIFDTTLEENLRLARRDASLEELEHALTAAHLDGLPARLPDGWGTELGPFGSRLSGGERQRLSVARALLGRFPVLVLDEPAEYLETEIGDALVAELLSSSEPTALLLITHRLAPLHRADEILVMDEGRVIERGSHQDLVAVGGLYKALWNAEQSEAPRDPFSGRSRPIARNGRRGVASAPFPCRGPESGEAADEFAS